MNVLIILGHPRQESFNDALASAYREGARESDVDVRKLDLAELAFEPHVETQEPTDQYLEPDLADAQEQLLWADHLVFVYPNWWGTMPALLKGFFDRVFTPGFAFSFYEDDEGAGHEELLAGRTAELVVTMDMPAWVYKWIYRQPGTNALKRSTLGFAGIQTTRVTPIGPVKESTSAQRLRWLDQVESLGAGLPASREPRRLRIKRRLATSLKALRLQFYPMSWVAYTIGVLAATGSSAVFTSPLYWVGFGFLFWLEASTVLTNDYFDFETDRQNTFAGPFTGGSRILVDDEASVRVLGAGVGAALVLTVVFALVVLELGHGSPATMAAVMGVLAMLALSYTVPPLQLSYRTLGELDVATTHSIGVLLCGFVFFGGALTDPTPWLVSAPLLLATLPSITLAGIPDYDADRAAGKRTIAVRFGPGGAILVAGATALLAALVATVWQAFGVVPAAYNWVIYLAVPHALVLGWLLARFDPGDVPTRIDGLMAVSLAYTLWFGLVPLVGLL